jgi:hypothetical protein
MIIVKPVGGLASQLHKYAIGKALADRYGVELKLDLSWFNNTPEQDTPWEFSLNKFNFPITVATDGDIKALKPNWFQFKLSNVFKRLFGKGIKFSTYSNESFLDYNRFSSLPDNMYLEGEFVGYKYFESIKSVLQERTSYLPGSSDVMDSYLSKIENNLKPTVSIHFRRGDFISNPSAAKFHNICSDEFYLSAIKVLEQEIGEFDLMVFSDEIEWVKSNFPFEKSRELEFVRGLEDYEEFQLMSMCKHNIISNSGFSWFSSWLNKNENIVLAPLHWVKDKQINQRLVDGIAGDNVVFLENE